MRARTEEAGQTSDRGHPVLGLRRRQVADPQVQGAKRIGVKLQAQHPAFFKFDHMDMLKLFKKRGRQKQLNTTMITRVARAKASRLVSDDLVLRGLLRGEVACLCQGNNRVPLSQPTDEAGFVRTVVRELGLHIPSHAKKPTVKRVRGLTRVPLRRSLGRSG